MVVGLIGPGIVNHQVISGQDASIRRVDLQMPPVLGTQFINFKPPGQADFPILERLVDQSGSDILQGDAGFTENNRLSGIIIRDYFDERAGDFNPALRCALQQGICRR